MADILIKGLAREHGIRFLYVDVTRAAREANLRHESGRTAAKVLAQALAGAALLSADASTPDECTSFQMMVDGPLGGLLVEATGAGTLRGYTHKKTAPQFDSAEIPDVREALGRGGVVNVITSTPDKVLYSGQVEATPPDVRTALARYYNNSLQAPAAVELFVSFPGAGTGRAVGLVAEKMPNGDTETFVEILERFQDRSVLQHLESANPDGQLWSVFELPGVETVDTRPLAFACRCSPERAVAALSALSTEEIREAIDGPGHHEITCQMCSETYILESEVLLEVLMRKLKSPQ